MREDRPKTLLVHVHNRRRIRFNLSGIYPMLPLGIAMLAAELERTGLPVDLLDLALPEHAALDVAAHVRSGGYSLVGLSSTLFSLPETVELVPAVRRAAPDVRIAVGGPATVFDEATLSRYLPDADVFVFGEGERVIVPLAQSANDPASLAAIPGIAYRTDDGIRRNPAAPPVDMNALALPARHLLPRGRYTMHPPFARFPPITLIETARGCPYRCAFCSLPRAWRARGIPHVLAEVEAVRREEGIREIHFVDPTFTADMERARGLASALAPLGLRFTFKTRIDLVDPRLLADVARAGCYLISYGIETFLEGDLAYLNKGGDARLITERIRQTRRAGIDTIAYMLVANPGETLGTVVRSVRRLVDAGCDFALFSDLFPDPATPLTDEAIARGRMTREQVAEFYFRQVPLPGKVSLSGHPARRAKRWVLLSFLLFYFSPRTIWRTAAKATGAGYLARLTDAARHLLRDILFPRRTV